MGLRLPSFHSINTRGFSLIEILIAVSIIAILSALAIIYFLSPKMDANEADVIAVMKKIYLFKNGMDGDDILDQVLPNGRRQGYRYLLEEDPEHFSKWKAYAWPIVYRETGVRSFYIDQEGYPRGKDVVILLDWEGDFTLSGGPETGLFLVRELRRHGILTHTVWKDVTQARFVNNNTSC